MAQLLLVEDDPTIGKVLQASLESSGHEVTWHDTGGAALEHAGTHPVDLVLLDLGLPDIDGIDVCRRLRTIQPGCVVVMLTARHEEMDVVVGLSAGADDYLTKPIRLGELFARIHAHLRRGLTGTPPTESLLTIGSLTVDTGRRRVTVAGQEVVLRTKEFDLLARLAAEPGVALSRQTLMADVWDEHWSGPTKTLDVHVAVLRRKLAAAAPDVTGPARIVTLRGFGYRLDRGGDGSAEV